MNIGVEFMFIRRESCYQFIRMYPVVTSILALNTIVFLLVNLPLIPSNYIITSMLGINLYIKEGELWRLITPIFLHSSFTHFLFNAFTIVIFGPAVELLLKPLRFSLFYLLCGVSGNIVTYMVKPLTYSHLGASGAIFGFLGFFIYCLLYRKYILTYQESQMIKALTIIALIMTFLQTNINVTAHLTGFIIGFLITPLFLRKT